MPEKHENTFVLKMNGMTDFKYCFDEVKITNGQPYDTPVSSASPNCGIMTINAGRHGSGDVANWFKGKIGTSGLAIGCATNSRYPANPKNLNFAFIGSFSFQYQNQLYQLKNIVIGQGHRGSRNNWWLGSPDFIACDEEMRSATYRCACSGKTLYFYHDGNSVCSLMMGFR